MARPSKKLENLIGMFTNQEIVTSDEIKAIFPKRIPASIVWQLRHKKGMTIKQIKEGRKITSYRYDSTVPGVVITGSKKEYDKKTQQEA